MSDDQEFEKYGVDETDGGAKTAQVDADRRCPDCGARLVSVEKTNVLKCPNCGTKPFERHE